ncbi:hypothetical protein [Zooshikella ganghwensis]|uniref:hypothetical protein n=1 Tax=Zooshikella ganghwensis TaxID=202772 RepID=UPI000411AF54|nr:hypothetical protein [Zooshikella ganghwensis]
MAYDLIVGKSSLVKHQPDIVGSIEFELYPVITALQNKFGFNIFTQLCDQFTDHTFDQTELNQAKMDLYKAMLSKDISAQEQNLIYKLIAVISYAIDVNQSLHGVAD